MSQIHKKLEEWQKNGLLTESQYESILSFENARPQTRWGQIGFLILGVGIVVLGLISIVASNWQIIPSSIKLISAFAILVITAYEIYALRNAKSILLSDGLRAFYSLFCFAVIGLIAQIYNLHGDTYKTGLLWSAITLLVVIPAKNFLLPLLWFGIFSASLLSGLESHPIAREYFPNYLSLTIGFITLGTLVLRRLKIKSPFQYSAECITVLLWLCGLCFASTNITMSPTYAYIPNKYVLDYVLSIFIASAVYHDPSFKKIEKTFFLFGLLIANILLSFNYLANETYVLLIVGSIICLMTWAFYFLSRQNSRLFNCVLIIIALKIFEIYAREFGSLLQTGVGLIATGTVFLLIVYFWSINRKRLEARIQELIR